MKDPEFRAEYEPHRPRMDLAMTLALRRGAGLDLRRRSSPRA